jgi:hypothetical protein
VLVRFSPTALACLASGGYATAGTSGAASSWPETVKSLDAWSWLPTPDPMAQIFE